MATFKDSLVLMSSEGEFYNVRVIEVIGWHPSWFQWEKPSDWPTEDLHTQTGQSGICCFFGTSAECSTWIDRKKLQNASSDTSRFFNLENRLDTLENTVQNLERIVNNLTESFNTLAKELSTIKVMLPNVVHEQIEEMHVVGRHEILVSDFHLKAAIKKKTDIKGICYLTDLLLRDINTNVFANMSKIEKENIDDLIAFFISSKRVYELTNGIEPDYASSMEQDNDSNDGSDKKRKRQNPTRLSESERISYLKRCFLKRSSNMRRKVVKEKK